MNEASCRQRFFATLQDFAICEERRLRCAQDIVASVREQPDYGTHSIRFAISRGSRTTARNAMARTASPTDVAGRIKITPGNDYTASARVCASRRKS
jgi:hypothetical protein